MTCSAVLAAGTGAVVSAAGVSVTGAAGSAALVSVAINRQLQVSTSVTRHYYLPAATGAGPAAGGAVSVGAAPFVVVSVGVVSAGFSSVFFDFLEERRFLNLALSCSVVNNSTVYIASKSQDQPQKARWELEKTVSILVSSVDVASGDGHLQAVAMSDKDSHRVMVL